MLTALTSMFMHASWLHIGGNMLFLWIFGNNVEDAMGRFRYLVFYLLGGFAATALQTLVTFHWGQPRRLGGVEPRRVAARSRRCSARTWCCCRERAS